MNSINQKNLYSTLIFGGVLPFLLVAVAPYLGLRAYPIVGSLQTAGALYTLVIISFMAGVHWGLCVNEDSSLTEHHACTLMLASNVYVVVPWLSYLVVGASAIFYLTTIAGFVLILVSDRRLYLKQVISEHYYRTRRLVTLLVVVCLLLTWFSYLV